MKARNDLSIIPVYCPHCEMRMPGDGAHGDRLLRVHITSHGVALKWHMKLAGVAEHTRDNGEDDEDFN